MTKVRCQLAATFATCWWLRPALYGVAFLHHIGMIRNTDHATKWIARNAITVNVEVVANDNGDT